MSIVVVIAGAVAPVARYGAQAMDAASLLPAALAGWSANANDRNFSRDNIFDYMDGAGEIYLAYAFEHLLVRNYTHPAAPPIVAELYQMSSSEDAYGIFSHDTDGEELTLGQGAIYGAGLLRFWKDRFFVRLMAEEETPETKHAVLALGRTIARRITHVGKKPALLAVLPSVGLVRQSVHYFHTLVSLNAHYYLADTNALNLSEKTEVILARYRVGTGKSRLLLCRYQTPREASSAFEQFCRTYFRGGPGTGSAFRIERGEKGKFTSARREQDLVILVFEAPDRTSCERLTNAVLTRAKEVLQWRSERSTQAKTSAGVTF